jgi:hypothetical protein
MNHGVNFEYAYLADGSQHARRFYQMNHLLGRLHRFFASRLGWEVYLRDPADKDHIDGNSHQVGRGLQSVPINKIVGSMGRSQDFDRSFRPLSGHSVGRWTSIDQAYHAGSHLPQVELYARGGEYYVVDGHHRISVARLHGQEYIDALVSPLPTA